MEFEDWEDDVEGLLNALEEFPNAFDELLPDALLDSLVPDGRMSTFFSDLVMTLRDGVEKPDEGPASSRFALSSVLMDRLVSSISPASNLSSVSTQDLM